MKHSTRQLALAGSSALLLLLADACSGSENDGTDGPGGACMAPSAQACACATPGQSGIQQCVAGTWGACQCTGGGGGDAIPCDVQTVLNNKCLTCHGATPQFGAPAFPSRAAFLANSTTKPGISVAKRAAERIQDPTAQMPPAPAAPLSPQEIAVLQNWANQGAPAGQACQQPPQGTGGMPPTGTGGVPPIGGAGGGPNGDGGFGNSGGAGGAGGTGGTGGAGGTGGTVNPGETVTCYKILARQNASNAKYNVPNTPDYYNCFNWAMPWGNKPVHIVSYKPIIDNSAVIHHWILYAGGAVADGTMAQCAGAHPNAAFIAGWAPGGKDEVMPPDIGLQVDGQGFNLEAHYNARSGGQQDASGVELCVTEQLRPKTAAVHWLGTQSLSKINATGVCRPNLTEPVNILSASPHMHVQGRHMKTVINRKGGATEVLLDKPFDFNTQISYPTPAVINPGDTLTTTCTYAQPTPFGQGTNAEMCYNFVTAYPVGKLVNGGGLGTFLRKNDCTQ